MTNEYQEPTRQMGLPPDLYDHVEERSRAYQQEQRKKKLLIGAGAASALVVTFVGGIWYADPSEATPLATLPAVETTVPQQPATTELATTTTIEATTTTSTTILRTCITPVMEIQSGESLFGIASLCNVPLVDLLSYNPEIVTPDDVAAGVQVRTAPPETTTSLPPETVPPTVPPETAPVETAPVETTPSPVEETLPPPPPETVAPVVQPNDGILSEAECAAANGKKYSFSVGETLMQFFKKNLGMSEVQAFRATKKPRVEALRLRQIYADDPNDAVDLRECVPLTTEGLV